MNCDFCGTELVLIEEVNPQVVGEGRFFEVAENIFVCPNTHCKRFKDYYWELKGTQYTLHKSKFTESSFLY